MSEHDRSGHQLGRFVAGVAKHQPLISSALLRVPLAFCSRFIDALRDVRRLRRDDILHKNPVRVENVVVIHVADLAHRIADELHVVELALVVISPPTIAMLLFHVSLTRHAALWDPAQTGVEHRIGDRVGDLSG
jgi:hypothetical protein